MSGRAHPPGERERIVGQNIRELREKARLSQTVLAQRCGWSQNVVAKLEGAVTNIRVGQLLDLADALGVKPQRLLRGTEGLSEIQR